MRRTQHFVYQVQAIAHLLEGADHIDIKTTATERPLPEFVTRLLNYQPRWVTFLYGMRMVLVRFIGLRQKGIPRSPQLTEAPMTEGEKAGFFTVEAAAEERYWFAGITESHLTAYLGVVVEPSEPRRCHVVTVVHYHRWTGRVYFNVIRPFHHLVVGSMVRAAR